MWACQSCWLTALKWPTEKQLIFSSSFFFSFFGQTLGWWCRGLIRKPNLLPFLWAKGVATHADWQLSDLQAAVWGFPLSCYVFCFFFFVLLEITLPHMDARTCPHIHKDVAAAALPCVQTVLFLSDLGGGFDWRTVIHGPARHTAGQVRPCEHLCLDNCFILAGGTWG